MNFALKQARLEKGLTQLQLAKLLGYKGGQSVSNWENGRIKPPLIIASKIAEILGKDIESLFFEENVQETHMKGGEKYWSMKK
ncbi:MAG: helix-turn-helix transcriptional regulator [Thermoactinomyces sp.]